MTDPYDIAKERKIQKLFELIKSGNMTASFILDNEIRIDGRQVRLTLTAEVCTDDNEPTVETLVTPDAKLDA